MATYEIYGVKIAAPFPLVGAREVPGQVPDLTVNMGTPRPLALGAPSGTIALDAVIGGESRYALGYDEHGYHFRIARLGGMDLDMVTGSLRCTLDPGAKPGMLEVFLTGMVPALWLYLRDEFVLHAATVVFRGLAMTLVGWSGMGKSTAAALMCAGGAELVGDDVLCVRFEGHTVTWHGRSPELRLRPGATLIADELLPHAPKRSCSDERLAVAPPAVTAESGPLGVVLVPLASPQNSGVSIRRLAPMEALTRLSGFPRLIGWRSPSVLRRQFDGLASLVNRVPVFELAMPWGPPFPRRLAEDLWPLLAKATETKRRA